MAQVLVKGTAWERSLEDYAYVTGLDRPGWAWEFLRRHPNYQLEWYIHKPNLPKPRLHPTGVTYCCLEQSCNAAEQWGLSLFIDPQVTALKVGIHWHPDVMVREVFCIAKPANNNNISTENISSFNGHTYILSFHGIEHVIIQRGVISARLAVKGRSLLKGDCQLIYQIEGLARVNLVHETLTNLRRLKAESQLPEPPLGQTELRLRECLVALDGHLAGRSYRDIAEVIYGPDSVKEVWANETRHLKDKVRRAVAAGIDYMNGGYLKLLQ